VQIKAEAVVLRSAGKSDGEEKSAQGCCTKRGDKSVAHQEILLHTDSSKIRCGERESSAKKRLISQASQEQT